MIHLETLQHEMRKLWVTVHSILFSTIYRIKIMCYKSLKNKKICLKNFITPKPNKSLFGILFASILIEIIT
jgi:hypothetical protein